jgi:hypothetical protein
MPDGTRINQITAGHAKKFHEKLKAIDWKLNRMSIPEPKVEHHEGRGIRSCPIFPELRPILDEAFEIFCDKSASVDRWVAQMEGFVLISTTGVAVRSYNFQHESIRL